MRYETLGDYVKTRKGIDILVYAGLTPVERKCVAIHELVEQTMLEFKGITPAMVDSWDTEDTDGAFDPNMYDKHPLYKKADAFALMVEKELVKWAGLKWSEYDKKLDGIKIRYNFKKK